MATPRDIRRLALVALYQLDARMGEDAEQIREGLDETIDHSMDEAMREEEGSLFVNPAEPFTGRDKDKAFELARAAYDARDAADTELESIAPDWPPRRMAAIDRAILRLGHFEMTSGRTGPKVVVNEAVELAKSFSTDRSPSFINGVLGKVLKRVLGPGEAPPPIDTEHHADVTTLHLGGAHRDGAGAQDPSANGLSPERRDDETTGG